VCGLQLAVVNHAPALPDLGDEREGVRVAGLGHTASIALRCSEPISDDLTEIGGVRPRRQADRAGPQRSPHAPSPQNISALAKLTSCSGIGMIAPTSGRGKPQAL
jgi:hypothetical protein